MFTDLTFTRLVMTPNDVDAPPIFISALHVLATITMHRLVQVLTTCAALALQVLSKFVRMDPATTSRFERRHR
jgi:hypothetical protein